MTDTENTSTSTSGPGAPTEDSATADVVVPSRRYRPRGTQVRDQRLTPRFTGGEVTEIRAAAEAAALTVTGFCAMAALAVARRRPADAGPGGETPAGVEELAELQRELFAARTAVNRIGVNLNQAVTQFNTTGAAPVWLRHAADRVAAAVAEVDGLAARITSGYLRPVDDDPGGAPVRR
jgi:hypothetical protein